SWLLDLLYWVVLAPLLAVVLLQANWGELRLYVLLGIGSGLALYFAFCSRLVLAVLSALTRGFVVLLAGVARLLWGVVIWPAILLRSAVYAAGADRWGRAGREPIGRDRPGQDRAGAGGGRWPSRRPWSWRLPRLLPVRVPLSLPWGPGAAWGRREAAKKGIRARRVEQGRAGGVQARGDGHGPKRRGPDPSQAPFLCHP